MPGIIVGIDGSGYSQRAHEWAMNEAALRHVPLTVITVHEVAVGYWASAITYPEDHALADQAHCLAQDEADKVLAGLAGPRPGSVTVEAITNSSSQVTVMPSAVAVALFAAIATASVAKRAFGRKDAE